MNYPNKKTVKLQNNNKRRENLGKFIKRHLTINRTSQTGVNFFNII